MLKQRGHRRVLAPVERPLVLPDHDRVPAPLRIRQLRHQRSGLRAPRPRQLTGLPDIEELRRDHPGPGNKHHRLLQLPRPRRHRILPVLRRHPPVKREPQHPARPFPARPLSLSAHDPSTSPPTPDPPRAVRRHHRSRLPLLASLDHGPQLPHLPAGKHQPHRTSSMSGPPDPCRDIVIRSHRGMSGKSVDLQPGRRLPWQRLADLAVRARVRSSREGSRSVGK